MKHLVTGGSGYLGNLISRRLIEQGETVRILDIWEDPGRPKDAEFVNCSVLDAAGVARAVRGIDIVHNNAALVPLTRAEGNFRPVNVEGTRIVAEEAAKVGVKWFIHMSSTAIFQVPKSGPIDASTPTLPCEEYGATKLESEIVARKVLGARNIPLIVIRPRTLLGQGRLGLFNLLYSWISEGRNIYVIGSGANLFQFIHPFDLLEAYMLVMRSGTPGNFNVGTDRFGTLREGLEKLIAYAGTNSKVKSLPVAPTVAALKLLYKVGLSPLAPYHYTHYHKSAYFDLAPLQALGWKAKFSNDDMLRESYDWFLANKENNDASRGASPHRQPLAERALWLLKKLS